MKPLVELKKDILKYKKTHDKDLFADIIFNLDYLIRYFIGKCKKQYTYLCKIDGQELYNDSIVALANSMESFTIGVKPEYIPCRLKAYMVEEFRKGYKYKMTEVNSADRLHGLNTPKENSRSIDCINLKAIDYKMLMESLDDEEHEFLKNYLTQTRDNGKMAVKHGIEGKYPGDHFRIKAGRIIKKRFKK